MDVYWLEQTEADVPEENDWLSPAEAVFLGRLRFAKRRADWRLGRWTAKRALAVYLNSLCPLQTFAQIEICPAPSGAPEVFFESRLAPVAISLSHRNGRAICAVAPAGVNLGCDLELIEPHSPAFITDYFTVEEKAMVMRQSMDERPWLLAVLWSGKESAVKALRAGLRLDTRSVIVRPREVPFGLNGWNPLQVRYTGGQIFDGWWQGAGHMVRTIVAAPPPGSPIPLGSFMPGRPTKCVVPTMSIQTARDRGFA